WQPFMLARSGVAGPLGALDSFLKERQKSISDLRALFVFMGTGSFTASRTIATVANALSLANNVRVMALDVRPVLAPELILASAPTERYILPYYSAPARIGPPAQQPV